MTHKTVLYLRRSTSNANQEASLESQLTTLTAYANQQGFQIVGTYEDDAVSGVSNTSDRAGWAKMLGEIAGLGAHRVLAFDMSRITRSSPQQVIVEFAQLKHLGIVFHTYMDRRDVPFDLDSVEFGDFLRLIVETHTNNKASKDLAYRSARGTILSAFDGRWHGLPPFGYKKAEDGSLEPSEDAEAVRFMFKLVKELGGHRAEIHRRLVETYGDILTLKTVHKILDNPVYLGDIVSTPNSHKEVKHLNHAQMAADLAKGTNLKYKVEIIDNGYRVIGTHKALCTKRQFELAASKFANKRKRKSKHGSRFEDVVYPLKGLAVCLDCGSSYAPHNKQKDGTVVCRCMGSMGRGTADGSKCKSHAIPMPRLLDEVFDRLIFTIRATESNAGANLWLKELRQTTKAQDGSQKRKRENLNKRIAGYKTKIENLTSSIGDLDKPTHISRTWDLVDATQAKLDMAREELEQLTTDAPPLPTVKSAEKGLKGLLTEVREIAKSHDPRAQWDFFSKYFDKIELHLDNDRKDDGTVNLRRNTVVDAFFHIRWSAFL